MSENNQTRLSSISKAGSYEAMGEFWDTHDTADYWDQGYDVEFEIRIPRRHPVNIEAEIFERVNEQARHRGISLETLVNLWIADRLRALVNEPNNYSQQEQTRPVVDVRERQLAEGKTLYSTE